MGMPPHTPDDNVKSWEEEAEETERKSDWVDALHMSVTLAAPHKRTATLRGIERVANEMFQLIRKGPTE